MTGLLGSRISDKKYACNPCHGHIGVSTIMITLHLRASLTEDLWGGVYYPSAYPTKCEPASCCRDVCAHVRDSSWWDVLHRASLSLTGSFVETLELTAHTQDLVAFKSRSLSQATYDDVDCLRKDMYVHSSSAQRWVWRDFKGAMDWLSCFCSLVDPSRTSVAHSPLTAVSPGRC